MFKIASCLAVATASLFVLEGCKSTEDKLKKNLTNHIQFEIRVIEHPWLNSFFRTKIQVFLQVVY